MYSQHFLKIIRNIILKNFPKFFEKIFKKIFLNNFLNSILLKKLCPLKIILANEN